MLSSKQLSKNKFVKSERKMRVDLKIDKRLVSVQRSKDSAEVEYNKSPIGTTKYVKPFKKVS